MNLTKREKTLLYALLIVLLFGAFFLVFQETLTKIDNLDADLLSAQGESMKIRSALSNLDSLKDSLPQLKSTTMSIKDSLYSVMRNRQLDNLITELAVNCELLPLNLEMVNAQILPITSYSVFGTSPETAEGAGFETQNVYTATLSFDAQGTKTAFYSFIDAIDKSDGLRMTSFAFSSTSATTDYLSINFTISAFMTNITEETFNVGEETA